MIIIDNTLSKKKLGNSKRKIIRLSDLTDEDMVPITYDSIDIKLCFISIESNIQHIF